MLEDLQQPTLICLNKLSEGNAHIIIDSLHEKWQQARSDTFPDVIELYYQKPIALPTWPEKHQATLRQLAKKRNSAQQNRLELALIQKHWQRNSLIEDLEAKLSRKVVATKVFIIQWCLD